MGRVWRWCRRSWATRRGKLLLAPVVALMVTGGVVVAAAAYTSRDSYCAGTCHEMRPHAVSRDSSVHDQIGCQRCHIGPGAGNFVRAKLGAMREAWIHFFGDAQTPLSAREPLSDGVCTAADCHPVRSLPDSLMLAGVRFRHRRHAALRCRDCHAQTAHAVAAGRPSLDPASMAFCRSCHDGRLALGTCATCHQPRHSFVRGPCVTCHTSSSWTAVYTHRPRLEAAHRDIACEACHARGKRAGVATANWASAAHGCVACHPTRHTGGLARCGNCHTMTRWTPSTFVHPRSGCSSCHERPHPDRGSCTVCHDTVSWESRLAHRTPLGAHRSLACERCHTRGVWAGSLGCASCHGTRHGGVRTCTRCHSSVSWAPIFSHSSPLGAHLRLACERCHTRGIMRPALPCASCHGRRAHDGLADCARCHSTRAWEPSTYRHVAVGPHLRKGAAQLDCGACHPVGYRQSSCSCHDAGQVDGSVGSP